MNHHLFSHTKTYTQTYAHAHSNNDRFELMIFGTQTYILEYDTSKHSMSEFASLAWQMLSAEQTPNHWEPSNFTNVVCVAWCANIFLMEEKQNEKFHSSYFGIEINTQKLIHTHAHAHENWWFGMQRIKFNVITIDLSNNNSNKAHSNISVKQQQKAANTNNKNNSKTSNNNNSNNEWKKDKGKNSKYHILFGSRTHRKKNQLSHIQSHSIHHLNTIWLLEIKNEKTEKQKKNTTKTDSDLHTYSLTHILSHILQ